MAAAPRPYTLIAELTHRCPLRCAYCSNPLRLVPARQELETEHWLRVLAEAEALGVVQVNFTGGEPLARSDLDVLVSGARHLDLYVNLITSGVPLTKARLVDLRRRGLDALQLSVQDVDADAAAAVAGTRVDARKLAVADWVAELGIPLTLNVVLHRGNIERIAELVGLAERVRADRLELAHAQYLGWALANRAQLLPSAEQIRAAGELVRRERQRLGGRLPIAHVMPDYYSGRPRACMDGWGRHYIVVAPDGAARPCHASQQLGLETWNVRERRLAEIWELSPVFNAFRGDAWMKAPCRACPERARDHGGCRCQAHALTHEAKNADPACALSPDHALIQAVRLRRGPFLETFELRRDRRSVQN